MARHTGFRQALPNLIDVAALAADIDVRAAQIERRFRMIKTDFGPPSIFTVTPGARVAEPFHVRLRIAMTRNTLERRFAKRFPFGVT
jgi:hypothetical protein